MTILPPTNSPAGSQVQAQSVSGAERSSYSSIRVDGPYIAMTFDDGPHPTLTPRLLDILKERHIHATFFLVGKMIQDHPEIVQREIAEGHEVGNHTWDHQPLTKVVRTEGGLNHEIADTSALIKQTIGQPPTIMRPPYGATTPMLSRAIEKEYGMKVILWSVDPDDWRDPGASVVSSRILNGWKQSAGVKPGAIILSHDIHKGTIEAMPATLDALLAKGYKFVTVSELIALESKKPAPTPTPSAQKSAKAKKKQS
jgi:peptidoglycan/xylan/chitin deacetylase (PgdA/CDA1 family)